MNQKLNSNAEIFKVFKQVKINISLLDAIKQVPPYANFLKDLLYNQKKTSCTKEGNFN